MTDTPTATDDKPDELTRLRDAVKTLRKAVRQDADTLRGATWFLNGKHSSDINYAVRNGEAALAATANLVED